MSTTKHINRLLGVTESDGSMIKDVLYGRIFMDDREKQLAAWKAFIGMDLDSILKSATGLDNLEKFKQTWKDSEHWDEPGTDDRAQYEEAMYPALDIYYPIEETYGRDVYLKLRGKVQRGVSEKLRELGFDEENLRWDPETGKDIMGQIRRHVEGYTRGWVSYHRLDDYDAMEVLYR